MVDINSLSIMFVAVYVVQLLFVLCLETLNRRRLKENPEKFRTDIDQDRRKLITNYNLERSNVFIARKIASDMCILGIVLFGLTEILGMTKAFGDNGYVVRGLLFFGVIGTAAFLVGLPFDYYETFFVEEMFGFNQTDFRTWAVDQVKGLLLSMIIGSVLIVPLLWAVSTSPEYWWLWAFVIISITQLLLVVLYPIVIAPMFNKFTPFQDQLLARKVELIVKKAGMKAGGIFQMDAGRRSTHSNAYFTGLGKTKRIVLFDTLIKTHNRDEIIAVLAHELGHYKLRHVIKSYLLSETALLFGLFTAYKLLGWEAVYATFGLNLQDSYVVLFLTAVFGRKIVFFVSPIFASLSRRFERQADAFAGNLLGESHSLIGALNKLADHNLSNPDPHPLYAWFYYSHPPIKERIESLRKLHETCGDEIRPEKRIGKL